MKHIPLILATFVAVPGLVHAQSAWTEVEDDSLVVEPLGMTVDELDDASVFDASGERIGELDDILMGEDGSSMAASLDVGGFLGIGEKDVVIPLDELSMNADGELMVDMTKDQLEALPDYED